MRKQKIFPFLILIIFSTALFAQTNAVNTRLRDSQQYDLYLQPGEAKINLEADCSKSEKCGYGLLLFIYDDKRQLIFSPKEKDSVLCAVHEYYIDPNLVDGAGNVIKFGNTRKYYTACGNDLSLNIKSGGIYSFVFVNASSDGDAVYKFKVDQGVPGKNNLPVIDEEVALERLVSSQSITTNLQPIFKMDLANSGGALIGLDYEFKENNRVVSFLDDDKEHEHPFEGTYKLTGSIVEFNFKNTYFKGVIKKVNDKPTIKGKFYTTDYSNPSDVYVITLFNYNNSNKLTTLSGTDWMSSSNLTLDVTLQFYGTDKVTLMKWQNGFLAGGGEGTYTRNNDFIEFIFGTVRRKGKIIHNEIIKILPDGNDGEIIFKLEKTQVANSIGDSKSSPSPMPAVPTELTPANLNNTEWILIVEGVEKGFVRFDPYYQGIITYKNKVTEDISWHPGAKKLEIDFNKSQDHVELWYENNQFYKGGIKLASEHYREWRVTEMRLKTIPK